MQMWGESAAGLLLRDRERVLLQRRSLWVQHPYTWSIPGGALHPGETSLDGALREAHEETGLRRRDMRILDRSHVAEPVEGWQYTTHIARLRKRARSLGVRATWEASQHAWVSIEDVAAMNLHPGFAASWPEVKALLFEPVRVLFVCWGNICRSPLAEVMLRQMAAEAGVAAHVESVGLRADVGLGMWPDTAACAARHGLDGSAHRARQITHEHIQTADLVVVLDEGVTPAVRNAVTEEGYKATVLDRPALNPWALPAQYQEQAYNQIAATCTEVLALCRKKGA